MPVDERHPVRRAAALEPVEDGEEVGVRDSPDAQVGGVPGHSYLNASMGLRAAAFLAGYTPKNTPTKAEKVKERRMDHAGTDTGSFGTRKWRVPAQAIPTRIPPIPPATESGVDSRRNWRRMSRFRAPTPLPVPLPFVRSFPHPPPA